MIVRFSFCLPSGAELDHEFVEFEDDIEDIEIETEFNSWLNQHLSFSHWTKLK